MKPFHPLVSCIIPIYNAEQHLDQGIGSLLNQTYTNLEIILVDDCSTDASWGICQRYASEHSKIRAFKSKNNSGGPLRARERGIHEAGGEWITFMDCDDFVTPKYIENLVCVTDRGKYDIAVTGHSRLYPDGSVKDFLWSDYSQTTKERLAAFYRHYFLEQDFWTDPADTVGQNLVRATVAKGTDLSGYPDTIWGEDTLMALAFLANSKKGVNFVDHHDFYWRQREGSGSHGGFSTTADRPSFYRACYDIFYKKRLLPRVSVIIPVFNVEHYLKDCLESVIAQTYPNLEIILVDDKTPDRSAQIADEYADKHTNIQVIHKPKNEGLNMARATGFNASFGEYLLFVDSDDLLVSTCVEIALRSILKHKTDFVRFSMRTFKERRGLEDEFVSPFTDKEIILRGKKELYMTQFDPGRALGNLPMNTMTVWGALYDRKLVDKVNWSDANFRIYEDNIWTLRLLENASSGTYLGYIGYLYRFDDTLTDVLSKRLTGNSFNGKPIGYMEFWSYVWNEYRRYDKKYKIGAEGVVEDAIKHLCVIRAGHLTRSNLWLAETNAEYLQDAMKMYQERLDAAEKEGASKDVYIGNLMSEISRINTELTNARAELNSHLSIKRSAKLTLGNIKRRVKYRKSGGI